MRGLDLRGAGGLGTEMRRIALARALRDVEATRLAVQAERVAAYFRAGCASPVSADEDADAVRRELLRRSFFPVHMGAAA